MFRTEPMQKIRIVCLYEDKQEVTAALHRFGAIDLRKSGLDISEDAQPEYFNELSDMFIKVEGALHLLPKREVKAERHMSVSELLKSAKAMDATLDAAYLLANERKALQDDHKLLDYADYVAKSFGGVRVKLGGQRSAFLNFKAFETDGKTIGEFRKEAAAERLNLNIITNPMGKGKELLFITYAKGVNADNAIKKFKMKELDLNTKYLEGLPDGVRRTIAVKKKENVEKLAKINGQLAELSAKHYSRLVNLHEMLDVEVARAGASSMFKRTDKSLVVEGWVPSKKVDELRGALKSATKGKYNLEMLKSKELAPTLINRPKLMKPFEYLVEFFSVPRSDEVDPTFIFVVFFPIFYGLMISDAGYGIASLLFASWITTRTDPNGLMYNVAKIWQICAVSAIFFGVISNQYFGLQLNQYFIGNYGFHWISLISFDWTADVALITVVTVFFGLAQVTIGLVLGIVNNYWRRRYKLAVSKFTSMTAIWFGVLAIVGALFNIVYLPVLTSAAVAVASLIVTVALSGEEAIEIVNLISHPLSYVRIMGFGLASVILALLIDKAFTPNPSQGIVVFILYAVLFIALHIMNMILSMFEGILQGVRLNFIEFFSKFYIGGGEHFKPFHYERRYTEEERRVEGHSHAETKKV